MFILRKRERSTVVILLMYLLGVTVTAGAVDDSQMDKRLVDRAENSVDDEGTEDFQKWALFPIIASSTETGLMLGGLAVRFFEPASENLRTNTLDLILFGTLNEQFKAIVSPNFYFEEGLYHLRVAFSGELWPANFYGIGNDSAEEDKEAYDASAIVLDLELKRRFGSHLYLGASYIFRDETIDTDRGGLLEENIVSGWQGGVQSGPGFALTYDSRDNTNDARRGSLIDFRSNWFRAAVGSDYQYDKHTLEMSHFITLTERTGLALGAKLSVTQGNIPFRELSTPDGRMVLRGIENGRYLDRDLAGLQAEYRFAIAGRWGGVVFAETAQVAYRFDELTAEGWKYSLGGGLRYALNPSQRFNLRLDVSFVDDGIGVVLDIREAI